MVCAAIAVPSFPAAMHAGQVEQKRLSIPTDVPCAVQQWNGLIAVNYAARAAGAATPHGPALCHTGRPLSSCGLLLSAGITRHMRVAEAKRMCPELQLVHVQTIGGAHSCMHGVGCTAAHGTGLVKPGAQAS